jgi:glycosyltransferase involved in cell wall biosynthesis
VTKDPGPLRVQFLIGSLERGGTEIQLCMLAGGLRERGHAVRIVCIGERGPLAEDMELAGVRVEAAHLDRERGLRDRAAALLRIRRSIRDFRPDILHTFLYWANVIGVPLGRLARVPIVVSAHRSLRDASGARAVLAPWAALCERSSDLVLCNSAAVLDDTVHGGARRSGRAAVVPNGVELRDEVAPPEGPSVVLCVANLLPYKGHDVLFRAFAGARRDGRAGEIELRLAGAGPQEASLRTLAHELGIQGAVRFLGAVPDVPAEIERSTFTVLPSLSEGMPNAVLESMAASRAVIASDVGGVPELLDGGGGVLVPPADVPALAAAMSELVEDPGRAREIGRQGRAIAERRYSVEAMVSGTLERYRDALFRSRRGRRRASAIPQP